MYIDIKAANLEQQEEYCNDFFDYPHSPCNVTFELENDKEDSKQNLFEYRSDYAQDAYTYNYEPLYLIKEMYNNSEPIKIMKNELSLADELTQPISIESILNMSHNIEEPSNDLAVI